MQPARNAPEFCRVDKNTGEILEGPCPLPQKWGNVNGFNNLFPEQVKRYGWYIVRGDGFSEDTKDVSLLFLPEQEVVLRLVGKRGGAVGGKAYYVLQHLKSKFHRATYEGFYSDVLGEIYLYPNSYTDQMHRLNCAAAGVDYVCMAMDLDHNHVLVTLGCAEARALIRESTEKYNQHLRTFSVGVQTITKASDKELAVMLDTSLADYYE